MLPKNLKAILCPKQLEGESPKQGCGSKESESLQLSILQKAVHFDPWTQWTELDTRALTREHEFTRRPPRARSHSLTLPRH